ncbi:hypothetical protein HYQ03_gp62 [Arthrobacter phage Kuleana]|uniref:Uncharacterized protein n=1 Tax=Arthrobacter phage Kuleana TaxID=2653270 RepID=A0A5Q2WC70_9CAUD|nr:hypothetical protein HYQ03_gp62 [Arthrobacter phage Kuleana]QGH74549.1 hypothetical protein SEA_KULEANA_62 [Arthrobacter phage Kuleana]
MSTMRCQHCGARIERGPLRGALPWVHLLDSGVAGSQRCKVQGEWLETTAEPLEGVAA